MSRQPLFIIVGIVLLSAVLFEVVILSIAFFGADEVSCNWLWCSFTTTRGHGKFTQECYTNGIEVDCNGTFAPYGDNTPFSIQDFKNECYRRGFDNCQEKLEQLEKGGR